MPSKLPKLILKFDSPGDPCIGHVYLGDDLPINKAIATFWGKDETQKQQIIQWFEVANLAYLHTDLEGVLCKSGS